MAKTRVLIGYIGMRRRVFLQEHGQEPTESAQKLVAEKTEKGILAIRDRKLPLGKTKETG